MKDSIRGVVATSCHTILTDEPWQDLGFPKRPRHGLLFQRFRPAWRVAVEKRVVQEMLAAVTAVHVAGGVVSSGDVSDIVGAYMSLPEVVAALGYASADEGRRRLNEAIAKYIAEPDRWPTLLALRIDPNSLPDRALAARLLVGCAQFGTNLQRMVDVVRQQST
jgi:hypothetical protein